MKVKVWTIATCLPDEGKVLMPQVFASEAAALREFDKIMRDEWETIAPENDRGGCRYPKGDPVSAHAILDNYRRAIEERDGISEIWGRYAFDCQDIEIGDDPTAR